MQDMVVWQTIQSEVRSASISKDRNSILNCLDRANDTVGRYDSGKGNDDFP